jgi:DNA-binding response OmpR family regulator
VNQARILIVDDEPDLRTLIAFALSREGHAVSQAENGVDALERLRQETPDLIILDLRMPEMDGYELLQRIRTEPAWAAVPVIILSGQQHPQDLLRGLSLGADDYLVKPVETWELRARVNTLLRLRELRRRLAALEREQAEALMRLAGQVCLHMMNAAREIDGFFELELRASPATERRQLLEPLAQRSRQVVKLLEALGEYSRLAPSAVETLELREVLELATASCEADMRSSGHQVSLALPADLPPVRGRKFELGLAFSELLARAARAMPAGGTVRVSGSRSPGEVAIEVSDQGSGVPEPELLSFEPFAAADGAPAERHLALPVAHSILSEHSGRLEVRAVPGTGTTVRVVLPA